MSKETEPKETDTDPRQCPESTIDLEKLSLPFAADDVEWRISRAGTGDQGIWCRVLCYINARAIQKRLDEVCGVAGWQLTEPRMFTHSNTSAMGVGISILIDGQWVTKWDVSELTDSNENIPPFKGGFSGAMKRAGAQWGIGRYLYLLDETFADVRNDRGSKAEGWNYARLKTTEGWRTYYWKTPALPAWALPKGSPFEDAKAEDNVTRDDLVKLYGQWKEKKAPDEDRQPVLLQGFQQFIGSVIGDFPLSDPSCWNSDALRKCVDRLDMDNGADGIDDDVPFE